MSDFRATREMSDSLTLLAPLQSCARFCLEPDVFPSFMAWLRKTAGHMHPPEWFDPKLIRQEIGAAHDVVGDLEDAAHGRMS